MWLNLVQIPTVNRAHLRMMRNVLLIFLNCIIEYMKNEPAPAATGTSSEVSKDTSSTHLDDSTLLDICQEGIEEMAKIALDDYPNEFLTGYIEAFKDNIRRLRGEQSD